MFGRCGRAKGKGGFLQRPAVICSFSPRAFATFSMVANSGLPSGERALFISLGAPHLTAYRPNTAVLYADGQPQQQV